jgi:hypothetical protein
LGRITNPGGAQALTMGNNASTWTYSTNTPSSAWSVIDTTANAGTGPLIDFHTVGTSAAIPLRVTAKGTSNGVQLTSGALLQLLGTTPLSTNTASAVVREVPNDTVTGTTVNTLAKYTTTNKAIITATGDNGEILGIVVGGAGTAVMHRLLSLEQQLAKLRTELQPLETTSSLILPPLMDLLSQVNALMQELQRPSAGTQLIGRATATGAANAAVSILLEPKSYPIKGTANQVVITFSSGVNTFSLPQDIATTSTPVFTGLQIITGGKFQSNTNTGNVIYGCGLDASAAVTCTSTFKGADQTGTGNNGSGTVLLRGGDNASTGSGAAGGIDIEGGRATAAANLNGYLRLSPTYIKGGTYTANALVCFSADNTVSDCAVNATNFIGTAYSSSSNSAIVAEVGSQVTVNYDATVSPVAGWFACSLSSYGWQGYGSSYTVRGWQYCGNH